MVRLIRRQLVKRSLDMMQEIADREDKKVGRSLVGLLLGWPFVGRVSDLSLHECRRVQTGRTRRWGGVCCALCCMRFIS